MLVKAKLITITLVTLQKLTIPLRNSIEQDYNRGFEVQLVYISASSCKEQTRIYCWVLSYNTEIFLKVNYYNINLLELVFSIDLDIDKVVNEL